MYQANTKPVTRVFGLWTFLLDTLVFDGRLPLYNVFRTYFNIQCRYDMECITHVYKTLDNIFPLIRSKYAMYIIFFCISGDIGGSLGLFIGASVITVFEIVDFFFNNAVVNMLRINKC